MRHACALAIVLLTGCGAAVQSGPLRSVELVTAHARADDDALPIVVALHGRGGSPESFAHALAALPSPARVVLLEAPIAEAPGRAWFTWEWGAAGASEQVRALVPRIERAVLAVVAAHPGAPRPVVVGFSQGAMLVYALVARRPALFAGAVAVSGKLLPHVLPLRVDAARAPPVHAVHGDADPVVSLASDRESVEVLRVRGVHAELEVVPGAAHTVDGPLEAHFLAALVALLRPAR